MRTTAIVLVLLFAAAPLLAFAPTVSAAGFCTSLTRADCAGLVCMSSSPSVTRPENCNILYVPRPRLP